MEPSDCQSCTEASGAHFHSDESSGAYVADVVRKGPRRGPSRKKAKSSGAYVADVVNKEVQEEGPSHVKVDIDQAIDLMRFSLREGMAFLDNGSGRSFEERNIIDMSSYMVNLMFERGASHRGASRRMRAVKPTIDKDIAHVFAKEVRKGKCYMVLFVRYLNGKGEVLERLLGIVPEPDVKVAVDLMLSEAGLSLTNVRGQGYGLARYGDETFSELKTLLFRAIDALSKLVQESPQFNQRVRSLIQERGLNLDNNLEKPAQWAFTEDMPFVLLLMRDVLAATNELSLALDRNDLDAEKFMILLKESKRQLLALRDEGWPSFLMEVDLLCTESDMPMPDMGEQYAHHRWSDDESPTSTNLEHYHIHVFVKVINDQLRELDKRFSKESSELVCLASCLNPRNLFQAFDKDKLIKFARFYPSEFPDTSIAALDLQLQVFITDVRSDARFHEMVRLSDLSVKMVGTGKNNMYPLVYLLLKLALILPGTAAIAKTASSTMKFIDSTMMKEPCNQWTSDCLLVFLEHDIFESITNDDVIASL
ncbi:hypothetical protein SORBI_3001G365266 [Sorghum bicolor]|uniref:DUF4371 domain-containing protein n=1 Tax=Sorghum bicolor TaxID=4558 RepID=A0A1Z5S9G8_SORBI|nr:hypothetical protein SORBI_3001G365266 [Sorghum bicolor]